MKKSMLGAQQDFAQSAKLLASDPATGDEFGNSVALSYDGSTAIVGAERKNTNTGAVYVFTRSGLTLTEQQKLTASDATSGDYFGVSVSISSDGNTALVGAFEESSGFTQNGSAYVFTRSGSTWTQQAKLRAADPAGGDRFGVSVSLSADGNTALIGAFREDTSPYSDNGAAYVFTRSGSTWTQQQKLTASDLQSNDFFGYAVSLSADGNTALIGAYTEDTSPYTDNGAAYVFTRSGSTWTEQQKLTASDLQSTDYFGVSVSLSADGNTALIGALLEDTSPYSDNGAAYVFTRSGSTWTQQQKLTASDIQTGALFGVSTGLSADGNTAIVGAQDGNASTGTAYIFTRASSIWTQQQRLLANDASTDDNFGNSVAISSDANIALIGANLEDTSPNTDNGAAYIFST